MSAVQIVTIVLLALILSAFIFYFLLTYICYAASIRRNGIIGKSVNKHFSRTAEEYGVDCNFWKSQKVEKLTIENNGLKLAGFYIPNSAQSNKLAIVIHGYFSSHKDMTIQAKLFQDLGYNVFLPDLRAHGESKGKTVGMGYFDQNDILKWINYLNAKFNNSMQIAIFGWSMGGATACLVAGTELPSNVKCIISDCAYTTAYEEFKYVIKSRKMLTFPLIQLTNLGAKMFGEYYLKDADVLAAVKKSTLPILFIHGENDTFVPAYMTDQLYEAKEIGDKKKEIFSGAEHCKSYISDKARYNKIIEEWLSNYSG